jgi:hypothetical protein
MIQDPEYAHLRRGAPWTFDPESTLPTHTQTSLHSIKHTYTYTHSLKQFHILNEYFLSLALYVRRVITTLEQDQS